MDTTARPTASAGRAPESTHDPIAQAARHMSPVLGRYFERVWSHGQGHYLYDAAGKRYLDFANGIAVTVLGHAHPAVNTAAKAQVDRLIHICNAEGYTAPVSELAAEIAAVMPEPLDTVFFSNAGAEVIEGAIKLARRISGRPGIVAFTGGFHGRTLGAASLTSSSINYRTGYEPLLPSVYLTTFPDAYRTFGGDERAATEGALRDLERLFDIQIPPHQVAAIVIEAVQGEGGYNPAPPEFLRRLRTICDEHGILLVADEIQCGYGRTGLMWGFQHAGIVPDVVCLAKAIANGFPLAALVTRRELQERWGVSAHGSTFGGNPVACAAGLAVLHTIREQDLVANAAARGAELKAGLQRLAAADRRIGDVRGPGLMIGVEFVTDRVTREPDGATCDAVMLRCADLGLLVLNCGAQHQVIRWIPPLDVTSAEIAEGLRIFEVALASVPLSPGV